MKKIIPYIFILIIILGLFSPVMGVQAQSTPTPTPAATPSTPTPPTPSAPVKTEDQKTALRQAIKELSCINLTSFDVGGCLVVISYYVFFSLPAFILTLAGNLFNVLLGITISSKLYTSTSFIPEAWKVVRDLSNIFFIIILLYAAIEMILGIGHNGKKMIGSVIVMAMLINFSMFFSKVVIDTSNILALVFYNRIVIDGSKAPPYTPTITGGVTGVDEKNIGGAIAGAFNPAKLMSPEIFEQYMTVNGENIPVKKSGAILLGIIFISCAIFLFAAYAFFISGFAFLGRLVELWILIIFSPFAFMSFAIPALSHIEGIGWEKWSKRLVETAFMAPIFMFFLYLISKIIQKPLLANMSSSTNFLSVLLLIIIPAMIQIILLMKATEYAKKGSGQLGSAVIGAGKALTGLAIGAATGGTALALRATAGTFVKGASTGNTAANNIRRNTTIMNSATASKIDRFKAGIGVGVGNLQKSTGFAEARTWVGDKINADQTKIAAAKHARQTLEKEAQAEFHTSYNNLSGPERTKLNTLLDRNHEAEAKFGKTYKQVDEASKATVDANIASRATAAITNNHGLTQAEHLFEESRVKQGLGSSLMQASRTGTYDVKNLANLIAGEQDKTFNKFATNLTSAFAKSFRSTFSAAGVNFGNKAEGAFLKDLGTTITESLKSANIKVDLSHVGEEKKEGGGGGGHH